MTKITKVLAGVLLCFSFLEGTSFSDPIKKISFVESEFHLIQAIPGRWNTTQVVGTCEPAEDLKDRSFLFFEDISTLQEGVFHGDQPALAAGYFRIVENHSLKPDGEKVEEKKEGDNSKEEAVLAKGYYKINLPSFFEDTEETTRTGLVDPQFNLIFSQMKDGVAQTLALGSWIIKVVYNKSQLTAQPPTLFLDVLDKGRECTIRLKKAPLFVRPPYR